ncbi:hypothetical protein [Paraburkholderia silvatlantica]|uniref:hypothetical protein n=1 Tax=Paraburkholderia silvatlantica TaxID=321895 RepID=UPI0037503EFD
MLETSPLYLIEPIARGYRLDVLAGIISAVRARSRRPVFVVTREDFACSELARLIEPSWINVQFVASRLDLGGGAGTAMLGVEAIEALLDATANVMPHTANSDIVFLGVDDYIGALATHLPSRSEDIKCSRKFVFLYNSEDLIAEQLSGSTVTGVSRGVVNAIEAMDATLLAFEGRLRGERIGRRVVRVLPDPWHGHFSNWQRARARESYGISPDGMLVTAEIDLLLDESEQAWAVVVSKLAKLPTVRFALQGNLWALRGSRVRQVLERLGDRVIYAGPADNMGQDIKLIAATDLLLSRPVTFRFAAERNCAGLNTRISDARRERATTLGAAFDRDVQHMLVESVDNLLKIPKIGVEILRDELDRLAHQRLQRAFGVQFRAALRHANKVCPC